MFCFKNCLTIVFFCCMWLDVVIHVKVLSDGFEGFWELLPVFFGTTVKNVYCAQMQAIFNKDEYWYCFIWFSANQRKRWADWSIWWMVICISMTSMSTRTATRCSRNLIRTPKRLLRRSDPVRRFEIGNWPRNFEAAFANRRNFPGLLIFSEGGVAGSNICLAEDLAFPPVRHSFFSRSVRRVPMYFSCNKGLRWRRVLRLLTLFSAE